jgi:hypothetical protein
VHTLPIDGERQQFVIASELLIFWEIKKFKKSEVLVLLKLAVFFLW